MKADVFLHQNQRVSFVDAYSDVNGCPPVSDDSICETCANLMESAYVFRKMCRVAEQPIHNVCLCCLQEKLGSNDKFLNLDTARFDHNKKRVSFFAGYLDVNNYSLEYSVALFISEASICENCAGQLESGYAFRKMCQKTTELQQEFITKTSVAEQLEREPLINDTRHYCKINVSFNCKKCQKRFNSKIGLSSHRKIKHIDVRSTRDLYARVWSRKSTKLRQRQRDHDRSVNQMDSTIRTLQQHTGTIHMEKRFSCEICEKSFGISLSLNLHIKTVHQTLQFQCKRCPKTFQKRCALIKHVQVEHLKKTFACDDCEAVFNTYSQFYNHRRVQCGKILYKCGKCLHVYVSKQSLERHIEKLHENKEYPCKDCDQVFSNPSAFVDHNALEHFKLKFQCQMCPKVYCGKVQLSKHNRKEHPNNQLNLEYLNEVCVREKFRSIFKGNEAIIKHYRKEHLNAQYPCRYCDKVFNSSDTFAEHKKIEHFN
jgi:hypothetical protein